MRQVCWFLTVVAILAALGLPAGGARTTLALEAYDAGEAEYWFQWDDQPGRNPTITLQPGEEVVVTLRNRGHLHHNIHFEIVNQATRQIGPGQGVVLTFAVPEDAAGAVAEYFCDPHRELGMRGELRIAEAEAAEPEGPGIPGVGLLGGAAALLAAGALATRRR